MRYNTVSVSSRDILDQPATFNHQFDETVPRRFRLWEKKRGDRRTGSKLVGTAGEALFFASLFVFGSVAFSALWIGPLRSDGQPWALWVWLIGIVLVSLISTGIVGFVKTILLVGTTAERRRAIAKRATDIDLLTEALPSKREYPNVPRDVNLTNSPGIKLAYRLPIARSPSWQLLASGVFTLLWNGMVGALLGLAFGRQWPEPPDWYLTALTVPFAAIGIGSLGFWLRQLLVATAIGPTSLEVSEHPITPGKPFEVYLTQAGRLSVKSLRLLLVCEEEATYRQGTDTRTERRSVHEQLVYACENFEIMPELPYEHRLRLSVPSDAMHSFQSEHNAVHWQLVVQGEVEKWPDYQRMFPIVVYPVVHTVSSSDPTTHSDSTSAGDNTEPDKTAKNGQAGRRHAFRF